MEVILLKPYGYCSGVENAMRVAFDARQKNPDKKIVVLGMLVHNQDALDELAQNNIDTLYDKNKSLIELVDDVPHGSIVILTAHGHSHELENKLQSKNIDFIDATCPFVKLTFKKIEESIKQGFDVFYIGKPNHPESNAALSISKDNVHLVNINNPTFDLDVNKKIFVVNQTTFSSTEVSSVVKEIKSKYSNVSIFPSVCSASTSRQSALISLPKDIELIYVIGGKNSNNTKTLSEIAMQNFPNAKVFQIQNEYDVNKKDILGKKKIAISSGASTPKKISESVKNKIEKLLN